MKPNTRRENHTQIYFCMTIDETFFVSAYKSNNKIRMDFMPQSTKTQFTISLLRHFAHWSLDLSPMLLQPEH